MPLFLLKRLGTLIATLIATSIIVFLVLEVLPGDPALYYAPSAMMAHFRTIMAEGVVP